MCVCAQYNKRAGGGGGGGGGGDFDKKDKVICLH